MSTRSDMGKASLTMIHGPASGQSFDLTRSKTVLGRHPDCDIKIDSGAVSRRHAEIVTEGGSFFLQDLCSRNGTFLNDDPVISRRLLHHGDRLRVCDMTFRYDDGGGGERPSGDTHFAHDSSRAIVIEDTLGNQSSRIMSKLEVADGSHLRLEANPLAKLQAVLEITSNLSRSVSVDAVLPRVLESLFKIFLQADRGFVVMAEGEPPRLVPKAVKFRRAEEDDTIRISRTIVNQVMESREAILSADAACDSRFDLSQSITDFRIRSMMCAPLLDSDRRALGVIQIDTKDQRGRFCEEDLEVLTGVAAQAGIAIENAQLHENSLRQQRLQRDLQMARRVQKGFLPSAPPQIDGYSFFDFYDSAFEVGGDYYDYVQLPDGRLATVVADVSGKGISAALLTAKLSAETRYCLASESDPAAAVTRLNHTFSQEAWEDRFVTMILAVLTPETGDVALVNAGHMPPLVRRNDGEVSTPGNDVAGLPLGVADDFEYEAYHLELAPGDCFVLFTDGVSEAMNPAGELYGLDALRARLVSGMPDAAESGRHLLEDVTRHVAGQPQSDDMCVVCVGRQASASAGLR